MLYFQNKIVCISLGFSSCQSTHLGVASSRNLGPNITYNIGSEITRTSDSLMSYWVGPSRNTVFRRKSPRCMDRQKCGNGHLYPHF